MTKKRFGLEKGLIEKGIFSLVLGIFLITISGCAGLTTRGEEEDPAIEGSMIVPNSEYSAYVSDEEDSDGIAVSEGVDVNSLTTENTNIPTTSIPHEYNKYVQKWVNYFTGRGRPHMKRYLERSSRYIPTMKKILRSHGMPEDLVYLAMIESGFSSRAYSRAAAVGFWQFIRGTGKRYGLAMNGFYDERRDPVLSTHAAAKYLKGLYHLFGSWHLAIASYNVGENRVKREVMKHNTRDYWYLVKKRILPRETLNYVPKFIAARMIGMNPEKYGFTNLNYQESISFEQFAVYHPISLKKLAKNIGVSFEDIKRVNQAYITDYVPVRPGRKKIVRVPVGYSSQAVATIEKAKTSARRMASTVGRHKVRRGEYLGLIARRYRTTVSTLRRMNGLSRRSIIRAGKYIKVPLKPVTGLASVTGKSTNRRRVTPAKVSAGYANESIYTVRRGDNLSVISSRVGTPVAKLVRYNNLRSKSLIKVGQKLRIKPPTHSSAAKAPIHVVRRGDTLIEIAQKYGVTLRRLREINRLGSRSKILVGARLRVPTNRMHD